MIIFLVGGAFPLTEGSCVGVVNNTMEAQTAAGQAQRQPLGFTVTWLGRRMRPKPGHLLRTWELKSLRELVYLVFQCFKGFSGCYIATKRRWLVNHIT